MTIEREWQSYNEDVIPMDAPLVQRTECRLAFFASAKAVIEMLRPHLQHNAARMLAEIDNELERFKRDVLLEINNAPYNQTRQSERWQGGTRS